MTRLGFLLVLVLASTVSAATSSGVSPATTNNDDSCDIGVAPAATLLLPYFQADLTGDAPRARTTVFSVVNVSPYPQIARVTIWTDWAYPTYMFSMFLTGYDVKSVDLREFLLRGAIPTRIDPAGRFSYPNFANPRHKLKYSDDCGARTPQIPPAMLADIRSLLTTGWAADATMSCVAGDGEVVHVGSDHGANTAAGYVTIDVVANCSTTLPTSPKYFTSEILFDNVLIGDYQVIEPSGTANGYAGGSPLVHIRAIPEGGPAGSIAVTRLPYTFYDRLTANDGSTPRTIDRRQPLPSAFAARWIDGGPTGFETTYTMWREAVTNGSAACADYASNDNMPVAELVRFDERENAAVLGGTIALTTNHPRGFSAASVVAPYSAQFPMIYTTDFGGWAYLNLSNGGHSTYSASRPGFESNDNIRGVSQNWVVVNMFAEGRYGVSYDAPWLGNGCSPAMPQTSSMKATTRRLGPAANVNP